MPGRVRLGAGRIGALRTARPVAQQNAPRLAEIVPPILRIGAGEGIRTLDPNLGKVVLYP